MEQEGTAPGPPSLQSARSFRGDLLELLQPMRKALLERGEALSPQWPELAELALRQGEMLGWVVERSEEERGLAILALRGVRGFGQLNLAAAPAHAEDGLALLQAVAADLPPTLERFDLAVSAEPRATEERLGVLLESTSLGPGIVCIPRLLLSRRLDPTTPPEPRPLPPGFRFAPAIALGGRLLSAVDFAAFQGGPDAGMVADTPQENERLLEGLLRGDLGPPLREGSPAVLQELEGSEGGTAHLAGFALMLEENPHRALLADIAVHPSFRRRGLGAAILARSLRGLVALGFSEAWLWVTESNEAARHLYETLGFSLLRRGRVMRWTRPGVPAKKAAP